MPIYTWNPGINARPEPDQHEMGQKKSVLTITKIGYHCTVSRPSLVQSHILPSLVTKPPSFCAMTQRHPTAASDRYLRPTCINWSGIPFLYG